MTWLATSGRINVNPLYVPDCSPQRQDRRFNETVMPADHDIFDRELLRRRRERFASRADDHDFLLARVAEDLAWRLSLVQRHFEVVVNLGAHHGLVSRAVRSLPNVDLVIDTDSSPALLAHCDGPRLLADEEALPFKPRSLDALLSGLALQHVNDLPGTLVQIERVLKPDGLFLAALLGGSTLGELRQAFLEAETETTGGASPRVAPFADVRDLGGLLQRAGFKLPVADSDIVETSYPSALELLRDLRAMGASSVLIERSRTPLARRTLLRMAEIYAERFSRPDGRVTATFEIITITGWAAHENQQRPLAPGSAKARLADALGVPEVGAGEAQPVPPGRTDADE
jgi:SAM-dependent methyltransferase